jgi:hypothetical protein
LLANFPQNKHLLDVRAICEHGKTRNMRTEDAQKPSGGWDEKPHIQGYEGSKSLKIRTFPYISRTACHNPRANAGYDMMLADRKTPQTPEGNQRT